MLDTTKWTNIPHKYVYILVRKKYGNELSKNAEANHHDAVPIWHSLAFKIKFQSMEPAVANSNAVVSNKWIAACSLEGFFGSRLSMNLVPITTMYIWAIKENTRIKKDISPDTIK